MTHILQPKQTKISDAEAEKLLASLNISKAQLPKVLSSDTGLPEECVVGDVIKIDRKDPETGEINPYWRVVV